MKTRAYVPADTPWHLISLRPRGKHASMRRAAARVGARLFALSPWWLQIYDDEPTRQQLARALSADRVIFTSPAAADAAAQLLPLSSVQTGMIVAVGEGTAKALRRHGARQVASPARMDSEGMLALPALATLEGLRVGLVTAPGGRGVIAAQVQQRSATLIRANVYERVSVPVSERSLHRLQKLATPGALALSSGEALLTVLPQLSPALLHAWQRMPVVAASARLAQLASDHGFTSVYTAAGPMPAQLAAAACDAVHALR